MTCYCQLCGAVIIGREALATLAIQRTQNGRQATPAELEEFQRQTEAARDVQNFDLLAASLGQHIMEAHRNEALNMTACANLASKVYAMTQAESTDQKFAELRAAWRKGIMQAMFPLAYEADAAGAAPSGAAAES